MTEQTRLTYTLTEDAWDSNLGGWRCPLIGLPYVSVTQVYSGNRTLSTDECDVVPQLESGMIRWRAGYDRPHSVAVSLLVETGTIARWRALARLGRGVALVMPLVAAVAAVLGWAYHRGSVEGHERELEECREAVQALEDGASAPADRPLAPATSSVGPTARCEPRETECPVCPSTDESTASEAPSCPEPELTCAVCSKLDCGESPSPSFGLSTLGLSGFGSGSPGLPTTAEVTTNTPAPPGVSEAAQHAEALCSGLTKLHLSAVEVSLVGETYRVQLSLDGQEKSYWVLYNGAELLDGKEQRRVSSPAFPYWGGRSLTNPRSAEFGHERGTEILPRTPRVVNEKFEGRKPKGDTVDFAVNYVVVHENDSNGLVAENDKLSCNDIPVRR